MTLWTPINAASFTAQQYYEPWDAASLTLSGSVVTTMADKSGNGRDAQSTGSQRLTYGATSLSGTPGLSASGSQRMVVTTTAVVVANGSPNGNTTSLTIVPPGSTDFPAIAASGLSVTSLTMAVAYWSATTWYLRVNGAQVATGTWTDGPDTPGVNWQIFQLATAGSFGFGRFASTDGAGANTLNLFNRNDLARGMNGVCGGIGFASAATIATQADIEKVEGYLAWASGLQAILPGGHPYAGAAPTLPTVGYGAGLYGAGLYGTSLITANASITEAADTASSTASLKIQASASITEAGDTLFAAGASVASIIGSASITEAGDTLSSAGKLKLQAAAAITEDDDMVMAASALKIRAAASITEAGDSLSATASGPQLAIQAALSVTEANDTLISTATAFGWMPVADEAETWTPVASNDETWTPRTRTATNWS